jgi:hypothetical protein
MPEKFYTNKISINGKVLHRNKIKGLITAVT